MNFIKKIFSKTHSNALSRAELLEAKVCPNCWGRQDYDSIFVDKFEDFEKRNVNNEKMHRKAFIQQFVETHVSGIHLKSGGDMSSCPKCNERF